MADPLEGWKSLTDCLKKDALMLIGLYSEKARENIKHIREKINNLKIKTTKKNIINFRKDILEKCKKLGIDTCDDDHIKKDYNKEIM